MIIKRRVAYLLLALGIVALVVADEPVPQGGTEPAAALDIPLEQQPPDPCEGVFKAHEILQHLQPQRYAHLNKRLGGGAGARKLPDELGWSSHGPLSSALRISSRVISSLNPLNLLSKIPSERPWARRPARVSAATRERLEEAFAALDEAEKKGCPQALALRADTLLFPPKGVQQDLSTAYDLYKRYLDLTSDPHAQFIVGFFHATGIGGIERDQGLATLYYSFSALQGYKPAQMAMGYRYWVGIGVKEECLAALDFYESAGKNAYKKFTAGPPGGESLLLTPSRISDRLGGVFGPHATWSLTGSNVNYMTVKAINALARGESEPEILEYLKYNSDRGQMRYTWRLGHHYYAGSVFPHGLGGVSSGAEEIGEIPQSFDDSRRYFNKVARQLWPVDFDQDGKPGLKRQLSEERMKEVSDPAMVAASFLGRMHLRGEGVKQDFKRAKLWFDRAAALGDREAHNGLGIMYRDGLGVKRDLEKAFQFFNTAAGLDLPDAEINIGKMLMDKGTRDAKERAYNYFVNAVRHGSPFEAFYHLGGLQSAVARMPLSEGGSLGACGVAVSYYKLVSESGAWDDDFLGEANRAWLRGEEDKAMLGWWIAGEMGYEIGQNNVAFMLNRGNDFGAPLPSDTELTLWTRSAAQGNADAMVMVGDAYYNGVDATGANSTLGASPTPDYTRALGYYQTAAEKRNPMAYWNLGYMYENGLGVPRDWHLAKRNYDLAFNVAEDAYLPWVLSMVKLYVRSWWSDVTSGGEVPGLSLFDEDAEAPGLWEGIKKLFVSPPAERPEIAKEDDYEDYSHAGWEGNGDGDDMDEIDDMVENVIILAVVGLIMLLFWLRQRWGQFGIGGAQQQQPQQWQQPQQ